MTAYRDATRDGGPPSAHGGHPDVRVDSPFRAIDGWRDAHTEAARFIGESFLFGAVCGLVVEVGRSTRWRRHG
jgi:hypothetical protein